MHPDRPRGHQRLLSCPYVSEKSLANVLRSNEAKCAVVLGPAEDDRLPLVNP